MVSKTVKIVSIVSITVLVISAIIALVLCLYSRLDYKVVKDNNIYRVTLKYRSFIRKYYHNVSLHDLLDVNERKNVDPYSRWVLATNLDDPNNNDVKMVNATEKVAFGGERNWDLKIGYLSARSFNDIVSAKALFTNLAKTRLGDWDNEGKIFAPPTKSFLPDPKSFPLDFGRHEALVAEPESVNNEEEEDTSF